MLLENKKSMPLLIVIALIFSAHGNSRAQEEIFSIGMQLGSGARAIAMGGAFTAIGGDYSASLWNPAALAGMKRIEVSGSMSHLIRENTTSLLNNTNLFDPTSRIDEDSFTKFNDIGVVYPVPTRRGSLVVGFGYYRVKSFDSNFDFRAFNQSEDDLVNQAWREIDNGGLNKWIVSGAVEVSPNLSAGVGLNIWTGGSDFETTFREVDIDDIYTFERFTRDDLVKSDITGFSAKFGALFRMGEVLRLGATVSTPIFLTVEEEWSTNLETVFDDEAVEDSLDSGFFEYDIRSPVTFGGGAAISVSNLILSGDFEYNDWTQIRYETDPPFAGVSQAEANRVIRDSYRATTRIRLGAEFTIPKTGVSLRGGYFRDPSVFQNADSDEDKQFISGGVGFRFDKQVSLDVAYVHGFWKNINRGLPETNDIDQYEEDIKVNKLFVTLGVRL